MVEQIPILQVKEAQQTFDVCPMASAQRRRKYQRQLNKTKKYVRRLRKPRLSKALRLNKLTQHLNLTPCFRPEAQKTPKTVEQRKKIERNVMGVTNPDVTRKAKTYFMVLMIRAIHKDAL
mmetsp:Transcript_11262/g.23858  ORF Transcript_11262/g.23858 Transcript_11262/m.23858 type:complete len:120 (-) Transcript_11262:25-384(-)